MSRFGYTTASGVEIPAMIDMIDGGGAGRSGDQFEGGGILSLLANLVASPYGSVRERPGYGAADTGGISGVPTSDGPAPTTPPEMIPDDTSYETGADGEREYSPRRATEEDVEILQSLGGGIDLLPGDLLNITEVQMIEEARSAPAQTSVAPAPSAMTAAPSFAAPTMVTDFDEILLMDPFTPASRMPPAQPFGQMPSSIGGVTAPPPAVPGAAGVPSTLSEIERLRNNPNFTFDMFGGP